MEKWKANKIPFRIAGMLRKSMADADEHKEEGHTNLYIERMPCAADSLPTLSQHPPNLDGYPCTTRQETKLEQKSSALPTERKLAHIIFPARRLQASHPSAAKQKKVLTPTLACPCCRLAPAPGWRKVGCWLWSLGWAHGLVLPVWTWEAGARVGRIVLHAAVWSRSDSLGGTVWFENLACSISARETWRELGVEGGVNPAGDISL